MSNNKMDRINQYCKAKSSDEEISEKDQDLLLSIIDRPALYNGFVSKATIETDSGKMLGSKSQSETRKQCMIVMDEAGLRILKRVFFSSHGRDNASCWSWDNALVYTSPKEIVSCLKSFRYEL